MLTTDDVARRLGMSRAWVLVQIHAGALRAAKMGRNFRIWSHELDAFIRRLQAVPAEAPPYQD